MPLERHFRDDLTPLVDEVVQNGLGGLYGIRKHTDADAPRVMFGAHLDEVGFIVTAVTARGMLKWWTQLVVESLYRISATVHAFLLVTHRIQLSLQQSHRTLREGGVNGAPKIEDIFLMVALHRMTKQFLLVFTSG